MLDIQKHKSQNNHIKFPLLTQRQCDPSPSAGHQQRRSVKNSSHSNNYNYNYATRRPLVATPASGSTKDIVKSSKVPTNDEDLVPRKQNQVKPLEKNAATSNPVREANQKFFLVPEFQDPGFLKEECALAYRQVAKDAGSNFKGGTKGKAAKATVQANDAVNASKPSPKKTELSKPQFQSFGFEGNSAKKTQIARYTSQLGGVGESNSRKAAHAQVNLAPLGNGATVAGMRRYGIGISVNNGSSPMDTTTTTSAPSNTAAKNCNQQQTSATSNGKLNCSSATAASAPTINGSGNVTAHRIDIRFNGHGAGYKSAPSTNGSTATGSRLSAYTKYASVSHAGLPLTTKTNVSVASTAAKFNNGGLPRGNSTNGPSGNSNSNIAIKPLVHRTIPTTVTNLNKIPSSNIAAFSKNFVGNKPTNNNTANSDSHKTGSLPNGNSHTNNNNNNGNNNNNIIVNGGSSSNEHCLNNNYNNNTATRAIAASATATATASRNNNQVMQQQHSCYSETATKSLRTASATASSLDRDDIKYIDSDEAAGGNSNAPSNHVSRLPSYFPAGSGCNSSGSKAASSTRVRPKSTIVCSSNNSVFEKINNYKYANGVLGSSFEFKKSSINLTASSGNSASAVAQIKAGEKFVTATNEPRTSASSSASSSSSRGRRPFGGGIDSSSIKASIEKFNSLSEQKRLPLSSVAVTLRSHGGNSGSTSNLQYHRHSGSDFDSCNLRQLNSSGGGSLTRNIPRLNADNSHGSSTIGNVQVTTASISSKPVLTKVNRPADAFKSNTISANVSAASKLWQQEKLADSRKSSSLSTVVSGSALVSASASASASAGKTASSAAVGGHSVSTNDTILSNKIVDESIRSATTKSVLPPASPTTSRYWDRDSSGTRTSSLSTLSSSAYNNLDGDSKLSGNEKSEGLCGLINIGNTCFMNSIIQCLSHTNELTRFLRNYNSSSKSSNGSSKDQQILYEFSKLIREMWSGSVHSISPIELKRAISVKHRMYSDYNQQDAQEFLRFFLDALHLALNSGVKGEPLKIDDNLSDNKKAELTWDWYTRTENSLIRDLFVGQLKSTLRCTTCGNTSVTFDPFWDLSVPLPPSSTTRCKLEGCLDLFMREEVLDGDEMPTCSKCKARRKCTKTLSIQKFPKYLVIHLKRFSETRWSKLTNIVEFPTGDRELNMGPYGANANTNMYYSLYGISNHMGSTAGGHYVALCKHPISKKWHEFNDKSVSETLSESHLVSSSAYILFYERT